MVLLPSSGEVGVRGWWEIKCRRVRQGRTLRYNYVALNKTPQACEPGLRRIMRGQLTTVSPAERDDRGLLPLTNPRPIQIAN